MEGANDVRYISPQEGYQLKFLSSPADIVVGGGAAGVGKTYSLLLEPLRYKDVPGFGSVIFRRTAPQIKAEGALWDTSMSIYTLVDSKPRQSALEWEFLKKGKPVSKLKFSHLEYEKNIHDWQGSQIPLLGFDELTHFTRKMFFYLLTRNRSTCGVKPYVRATCNPDPDSWVAEFIEWWIDPETGYPIPERDGVLRYMVIDGDNYIWGDSEKEVIAKAWHMIGPQVEKSGIDAKEFVKSVTFISGDIYGNKELLKVDPSYLGNLLSQPDDVKAALLFGNWKVVLSDNDIYDYHSFRGCFANNIDLTTGIRYITADIALKGSDKFIVGVWDGFELIDVRIMAKSNGKEVVDLIKELCNKYGVPNENVAYDNDGVGGFVDGFIEGAKPFHNGGTPKNNENYVNLKSQCYFKSGDRANKGGLKFSEHVASMMYDDKMTIRQRLIFERRAIKRGKPDDDKKLQTIPKSEMKTKINGDSPDMMDMIMMREIFELEPSGYNIYSM